MGRVRTNIVVKGRKFWALFDPGSRNTYILPHVVDGFAGITLSKPFKVGLGGKVQRLKRACEFEAKVEGKVVHIEAYIIDKLGKDEDGKEIEVLFGALMMQKWGIRVFPDLPAPRPNTFFVYTIKCNNNSIYIGQTDNLQRRWNEHCKGEIDWTRRHRPIKIVHYEKFASREEAVKREQNLKTGFGRKWLKQLIESGRARQAGEERLDLSHYPKEFIEF